MLINQLKQEIDQQVAELHACREAFKHSTQKIKKTLTNPSILCGGLLTSFLVGYFLVDKPKNSSVGDKKNSLINDLSTLFSSPLLLFASTLFKDH